MQVSNAFESQARRLTRLAAVATLSAVLAACGSSVKLEDAAPVADRSSSSLAGGNGGAGANGLGQRGISGVQADGFKAGQAPANVERVVYFDFDSYAVRPEFSGLIDAHAKFLNGNSQRRVNLEGHTDERGGREYNLALGQKRAEAVRRALTLVGASDAQVEAVSFGEEKPAVAGSSEDAYAKNRRVEIRYR